jgi:N,N'-diacetyllegionaminate synthase
MMSSASGINFFASLQQTYVIAEIGVNHNGDLWLAKDMIDAAKGCGANAVKFQTFTAASLAAPDTPKVSYQMGTTMADESHFEMLRRLELSHEAHCELAAYCDERQIEFLSTPYDLNSARFLDSLGVRLFKTASADIVDLPLQRHLAESGKPVIVATGMANLGEIERVVQIYREAGNPHLVLLHCVSNYPCSDGSLNIRAMETLASAFCLPIGFSDHSEGHLAATLAVALGARVIEKHFTMDRGLPGPDHKASSTPVEFAELVSNVRRAEIMLGERVKRRQPEEHQMASVSRKSLVLARHMEAKEVLAQDDLELRRPGTGLAACFIPDLVGRVICRNLPAGHQIKWADIEDA